jgi:hypothetical protein
VDAPAFKASETFLDQPIARALEVSAERVKKDDLAKTAGAAEE